MNTRVSTAAALLTITLSGCSIFHHTATKPEAKPIETTKQPVTSAAKAEVPKEMEGRWAIVQINGENVKPTTEQPTISFEADKQFIGAVNVIGYNGCNYLNGTYIVEGSQLRHSGEFISTLKSCANAPYEIAINQALNIANSYSLNLVDGEYTMSLNDAEGAPILIMRRHDLDFLNGAWRVTAIDNTPLPEHSEVAIVIDLEQMTIHGNAGCNVLNGEIVSDINHENGLKFTQLATTRMTCPDIATEQKFISALQQVASASKVGTDNTRAALRNSHGENIISLVRIDASQLK